jgi:hypothetical protein
MGEHNPNNPQHAIADATEELGQFRRLAQKLIHADASWPRPHGSPSAETLLKRFATEAARIMSPSPRAHVVLVSDETTGMWDGLYVGGQLAASDDALYAGPALRELAARNLIEFSHLFVELPDEMERAPKRLADLEAAIETAKLKTQH